MPNGCAGCTPSPAPSPPTTRVRERSGHDPFEYVSAVENDPQLVIIVADRFWPRGYPAEPGLENAGESCRGSAAPEPVAPDFPPMMGAAEDVVEEAEARTMRRMMRFGAMP